MPSITKKYRDFDMSFIPHPVSGDIGYFEDFESVRRSIKNLVLTNYYERLFQPKLGSDVVNQLFENINPMTKMRIKLGIEQVIKHFEPRAELISVIVVEAADLNGYNVSIKFAVTATSEIAEVDFFLERVR